ncbi:hypothetical protein CISIN_1g035863mg [Citrus sinensis]|uniref:Uncharacterized protein n=1 Tax=Citrus sinensis TaxID=2711 RepID=A0A067F8I4_CITSI|nr:hypothetical protein CISIN_1g035863mg [Citrus sinensis]
MVNEVLKIGVGVGIQKWCRIVGDFVKREKIEKAVNEIMVGDRAEEMRSRAKALGKMAKRAVENGGSSYSDLSALIEENCSRWCNSGESARIFLCEIATEEEGLRRLFWAPAPTVVQAFQILQSFSCCLRAGLSVVTGPVSVFAEQF